MSGRRLTDAAPWRPARVQHSQHAEGRQPDGGVPLQGPQPLPHPGLPRPRVSCTRSSGGGAGGALDVSRGVHGPKCFKVGSQKNIRAGQEVVRGEWGGGGVGGGGRTFCWSEASKEKETKVQRGVSESSLRGEEESLSHCCRHSLAPPLFLALSLSLSDSGRSNVGAGGHDAAVGQTVPPHSVLSE